jgi:hypothetical protein
MTGPPDRYARLGRFALQEFGHYQLVRVLRLLPTAKLELKLLRAGLDDKL